MMFQFGLTRMMANALKVTATTKANIYYALKKFHVHNGEREKINLNRKTVKMCESFFESSTEKNTI